MEHLDLEIPKYEGPQVVMTSSHQTKEESKMAAVAKEETKMDAITTSQHSVKSEVLLTKEEVKHCVAKDETKTDAISTSQSSVNSEVLLTKEEIKPDAFIVTQNQDVKSTVQEQSIKVEPETNCDLSITKDQYKHGNEGTGLIQEKEIEQQDRSESEITECVSNNSEVVEISADRHSETNCIQNAKQVDDKLTQCNVSQSENLTSETVREVTLSTTNTTTACTESQDIQQLFGSQCEESRPQSAILTHSIAGKETGGTNSSIAPTMVQHDQLSSMSQVEQSGSIHVSGNIIQESQETIDILDNVTQKDDLGSEPCSKKQKLDEDV